MRVPCAVRRATPALEVPIWVMHEQFSGLGASASRCAADRSRGADRHECGPTSSGGAGESACRPGSVHPLARAGGHPSGTAVAGSLVRSTREHRAGRPQPLAQPRGTKPRGLLDLAPGGVYRAAAVTCGAGGLLHHHQQGHDLQAGSSTSNYALIREIRTVTRPAVPGPCRRQSSACRKRQQPSAPNGAHARRPGE